ncbi:MAG: helix-turn-helix domain-containing protein [Thermoplasmatota archaeon]
MNGSQLADEYGVSASTIYSVLKKQGVRRKKS